MEVTKQNAAMLSNMEVLSLLNDIQSGKGQKKPNQHQPHLATITYETVKYLENTACAKQTPKDIAAFMKAVEPYKLTRAEKLQLLNHRSSTAVEIQLIVEESEERLTEQQIYELLEKISEHLPGEQETEEQNMEEEEQDEGEQDEEEEET